MTLAEKGREMFRRDALSVIVEDDRYCEVADPTGKKYIVDLFGGLEFISCECEDHALLETCMHVGAVAEFYFEAKMHEIEEVYA